MVSMSRFLTQRNNYWLTDIHGLLEHSDCSFLINGSVGSPVQLEKAVGARGIIDVIRISFPFEDIVLNSSKKFFDVMLLVLPILILVEIEICDFPCRFSDLASQISIPFFKQNVFAPEGAKFTS